MTRFQLEHVLRAAGAIGGDRELIVFGSQALLGTVPNAPAELLVSQEVDLMAKNSREATDLIDGAIGELSSFHTTFGYYAHGVDIDVATLPNGWESRLVAVQNENTMGAIGWCLEIHDLAVSKLAAGREKDFEFVAALLRHQLASHETIGRRLAETSLPADRRALLAARLERIRNETKESRPPE